MIKEDLEILVEKGFTIKKISEEVNKSKSTVRYWLSKFNLKTKKARNKIDKKEPAGLKTCHKCKNEKSVEEFYRRRKGMETTPYCKPCTKEQTLERQRKFKKKCLEYKGVSCVKCGYNKCDAALEFHHLNPKEKDFSISKARLTTFDERVKNELDKCILVCTNCHREIHSEMTIIGSVAQLD